MDLLTLLLITAFSTSSIIHSTNKLGGLDRWEQLANTYRYFPDLCIWCACFWTNIEVLLVLIYFLDLHWTNIFLWLPAAGISYQTVKGVR